MHEIDIEEWTQEEVDEYAEAIGLSLADTLEGRHPYSVVMAIDIALEQNLDAVANEFGIEAAHDLALMYRKTIDPYLAASSGVNATPREAAGHLE